MRSFQVIEDTVFVQLGFSSNVTPDMVTLTNLVEDFSFPLY